MDGSLLHSVCRSPVVSDAFVPAWDGLPAAVGGPRARDRRPRSRRGSARPGTAMPITPAYLRLRVLSPFEIPQAG